MSDYTNCLLQGYGVLPGAPTKVHVSHIDVEFSIIHWDIPSTLGDTVLYYNVHYRKMATYDNEYHTISKVHSPFILENLASNTDYEVFVEAVNGHGVGEPSTRVIFRTESKVRNAMVSEADKCTFYYLYFFYNFKWCYLNIIDVRLYVLIYIIIIIIYSRFNI
jgi:hypothetical protein